MSRGKEANRMKARRMTLRLLIAVLISTMVGCVTYEEGSLLQMQHKQQQRLYMACMREQLDRNLQYIVAMSSISTGCRKWARKQMKPYLQTSTGRKEH